MRWRRNEENGGSGLKKGEEEKSSGVMLKNEIIKIDSRIKQIYEVGFSILGSGIHTTVEDEDDSTRLKWFYIPP